MESDDVVVINNVPPDNSPAARAERIRQRIARLRDDWRACTTDRCRAEVEAHAVYLKRNLAEVEREAIAYTYKDTRKDTRKD